MNNFYSFVVPIYNERKNIVPTIEVIEKYFINENFEILFVDDNSPDGSAEEVISLSEKNHKLKLIQHGKKEGIGAALFYGCKFTKGNLIIFLDADLSQSPFYIKEMMKFICLDFDMVIGSRYLKGSKQVNQTLFKKYGSFFFNKFTGLILNINLKDITHSFRIFKKNIFNEIGHLISQKGHPSFLIEFTLLAKKNNFKITEYPVTFIERDSSQGVSKLSISKELIISLKFIISQFLR